MYDIEVLLMNNENDFVLRLSLITRQLCLYKITNVKHIKFTIFTIFKCI